MLSGEVVQQLSYSLHHLGTQTFGTLTWQAEIKGDIDQTEFKQTIILPSGWVDKYKFSWLDDVQKKSSRIVKKKIS